MICKEIKYLIIMQMKSVIDYVEFSIRRLHNINDYSDKIKITNKT